MVIVTRSASKKSCNIQRSNSFDLSENSSVLPWCSAVKSSDKYKTRITPTKSWEIQSFYPRRENIWEYLHNDKPKIRLKTVKRKQRDCCCKNVKKKSDRRIVYVLVAILLGTSFPFWRSKLLEKLKFITHSALPTNRWISFESMEFPTSVDDECCYRLKYLSASLLRAEQALSSAQRLRRSIMMTLPSLTTDLKLSTNENLITNARVSKGANTIEFGGRVALWGLIPLWRAAPSPDTILSLRKPTPADCWPFSGSYGEVKIELPRKQRLHSVSIQHVRPDSAQSALKRFLLHGILDNGTWIKVIDNEYSNKGPSQQSYQVSTTIPLSQLILQVLSNHGNEKYTCIYRMHLYNVDTN